MRVLPVLLLLFAAASFAQNAETYRRDATRFAQQKSWDQTIANYRKALELEPNDALTHYDLALALKYKGNAAEALQEFQTAAHLKPEWPDAHYGLGATWYDLHDQAAAVKELHAAIDLNPSYAAARRLLARIDLEQNNPSDAKSELQRAIASKPSPELYIELGLAEGQLGNL